MKRNLFFLVAAISLGVICVLWKFSYHFFYPQRYRQIENGQYINIETSSQQVPFPIDKMNTFVIEYYYPEEERLLKEEVQELPELLGLDKLGVENYLKEYMQNLSREEKEDGLVSYQLVQYRGKQITLRKTYRKNIQGGYYAQSFNGNVVILKNDRKTVYEYTQIMIHLLPEDMREKVIAGLYLENDEELYNFLENYSS